MREKELKPILKFSVKLVLILAAIIGCAQLFSYGKDVAMGGSNGPAVRTAAKNSETRNNQSDSVKTEEQENVLRSSLSNSEKGRQQTPETIAPFAESSDGPGNVVQTAPSSGDVSLDPAGGKNEPFSASGPTDASRPMIAFAFDGSPYYSVDIGILDTLQAYEDRATPFIVRSYVSNYRDTPRRIRDSRSKIGNHTFNHENLEKISPEEVVSQIEMTNDAMKAVTGFWPKLVRIPYGAFKSQVSGLVPYPMIQQDIDTQDWSGEDKGAITVSVLSQTRDEGIVLMHGLYPATVETFGTAIPLLAVQEYQFVTVSEIYAAKGVPPETGQAYFSVPN